MEIKIIMDKNNNILSFYLPDNGIFFNNISLFTIFDSSARDAGRARVANPPSRPISSAILNTL